VHIAPDGNNKADATYLTQVTMDWGGKIAKARLNHAAVDYCLRLVVYQKLTYPLVTMSFTEEQCAAILKPLLAMVYWQLE